MKQPRPAPRAFNVSYSGLTNILISDIAVSHPFQGTPPPDLAAKQYKAIWDTGATNSVITEYVVSDCGLQPTGAVTVRTPKGEYLTNTY